MSIIFDRKCHGEAQNTRQERQLRKTLAPERPGGDCETAELVDVRDCGGESRCPAMKNIFSEDRKTNRRNARCLCQFPDEVPLAKATKFLESVTFLGVVTRTGGVRPPQFFGDKDQFNTVVSLNVLEVVAKPWLEEVTGGAAPTGLSTRPCRQEEPGVVQGQFQHGVKKGVLATDLNQT